MDYLAMEAYTENSLPVKENFLDQWEPPRRALVANLFCHAVRDGAKSPDAVIEGIRAAIRLRDAKEAARQGLVRLHAVLDTPSARDFAQRIIERESMPRAERQKEKAKRANIYQKEWMKNQPPTRKQLDYLRILGCDLIPRNRFEASEIIDERRTRGCVWP